MARGFFGGPPDSTFQKISKKSAHQANKKMASLDVLRKSLAANGLPVSGNKTEMLNRLLYGQGDKRKSGAKKAAAAAAMPSVATPDVSDDEQFVAFAATERTNITASGAIESEEAIDTEIMRRWIVIQNLKPPAPVADVTPKASTSSTKILPLILDASQLAQANLTYVGPIEGNQHMYVQTPKPPVSTAPVSAPPSKKVATADGKKKAPTPVVPASDPAAGKRKEREEDGADDEEGDDMSYACRVTAMRLLKKVKKEHMLPLLNDFGVPTKGSKEELVEALAEQLHYETDESMEGDDGA
jgi:hypothetical protein